jgi:hypothetical protein
MPDAFPFGGDIETSAVAQLIECGLVARYKDDPDGLKWARQQVRNEMRAKGWVLSPYTFAPA